VDVKQTLIAHGYLNNEVAKLVEDLTANFSGAQDALPRPLTCFDLDEQTTPQATELADRVFSVPELFERILQNLDARRLLVAQQVSRVFRDTIEG